MTKPAKPKAVTRPSITQDVGYQSIFGSITELLNAARRASARSVNSVVTVTYWLIGQRIVEFEQGGERRAEYGKELLIQLGNDLSQKFGRGFGWRNLFQMRSFYLSYPAILQTPSAKSTKQKSETVSRKFDLGDFATAFPLPWSHYVRLSSLQSSDARKFYEEEALRGGWSVRQLDRQISTQFYERTLMSRNKAAMLTKGQIAKPEDTVTPEEEIKDPFLLEFLGLKDEYSESELEEALIHHLETFLLELGGDFAFIGRQRRLRIGNVWYRIDLLFFHRKLRCLVVIDLKTGELTHADTGQMHLYLTYAKEHWMNEGENPPVGLILCAEKNNALAHYALEGLPNKVLAAQYKLNLPDEKLLVDELERTKRLLETHKTAQKRGKK